MTTKKDIFEALHGVMHPELKRSLVELDMIRQVEVVEGSTAMITVALPFLEIPIKETLMQSVEDTVMKTAPNLTVKVKTVEMSQKERARFMNMTDASSTTADVESDIKHVIAVLSGKGGVGKSSVTSLLAVALNRSGKRVGVLDADITGPSIPKMFGLKDPPIMGEFGIIPVETPDGAKIMSINLLLPNEDEAVIWRGPRISGAIKQFWNEVYWGELDYLIVDLPPGTSDASLTVMQSIPLSGIVLVTSPQGLAGMVVRKAARMAGQLGAPLLGIIENMSYLSCPSCGENIEIFGESTTEETAAKLGIPLFGRLPLDPHIARFCDSGSIESYKAEEFKAIAEQIVEAAGRQENESAS